MYTCWVTKESRWLKQWRKRFCQVNEKSILFSVDESTKAHETIVCSDINSIKCVDESSGLVEIKTANGMVWRLKSMNAADAPTLAREIESHKLNNKAKSPESVKTAPASATQSSKAIACDFFLSLRFNERGAMDEAKLVQSKLAMQGKTAVIINTDIEGSSRDNVEQHLNGAKMVVIFATDDYGEQTQSVFSSHDELAFIKAAKKPVFLIKMCDEFTVETAKSSLPSPNEGWELGERMPAGLIQTLLEKLERIEGVQ